jgi:hypothetical protein
MSKRSEHELKRLIEEAIAHECGLPRPGLWFCIDHIDMHGKPPEQIGIAATLHFLPAGAPFCCGEPGCHLGLFGPRLSAVGEHVRLAMGLTHQITIELQSEIRVVYHPGVTFNEL